MAKFFNAYYIIGFTGIFTSVNSLNMYNNPMWYIPYICVYIHFALKEAEAQRMITLAKFT